MWQKLKSWAPPMVSPFHDEDKVAFASIPSYLFGDATKFMAKVVQVSGISEPLPSNCLFVLVPIFPGDR
jgi:hypothetical protein